ncbi:hypothetical protein [Umezawaea sp.]|uniref:sunset domain-containing protein n=1 Tax=Umezawaea sp. TaxID=1955258 RepID=UPI002ED4DFED
MVSLFGQVWLWSLLSFVAGVLVTWLVQVRPARQRLAELEANRLGASAGPAKPQPQTPPSPVSSPMRDEEFDDWHVGARANADPLLAVPPPVPDQVWPQSPAQEPQRPYEAPQAYEPPRPAEPPRPLEPQRLVEPPRQPEPSFHAPEQSNNDVAAFVPASAFGKPVEPEPEPEPDHGYDELPPALTRIPENAEPTRVVEPVEVPEEEKPRSLFQRLTPEDEVQAEPVPLNPAEEPAVFRREDLDEQPEVPEVPADRTRYLPPAAPDIAPPVEEPTAPPEVEEWHPREVWRDEEEEEQPEADQPAESEHEDELLDDREEDFAADDAVPAERTVPAETAAEETSVIPAGEVQRAIDAADAEREAERQPWPEHSLTGQFPIVSDDIASSKGQLGVEPDDPDYRRDDPDELTVAASEAPAAAQRNPETVAAQRSSEAAAAQRDAEARGAEFRAAQAGGAGSGAVPTRDAEPEVVDTTVVDTGSPADRAPVSEPEPAAAEPESPASPAPAEPAAEPHPAETTEFFPAKLPPVELPAVEKRPAAANFFAPQPVEPEPEPKPAAKPSKSAPAQPAAERPRSLFEPIVDESDDDPEPAETVRQLPPTDDQPFVPTLAPELLARGSNGLPQRPQRPAGGPPPMTSPPLLGPPQPVSPPPPPPKPLRPRPVGFSPSTGGRSENPPPAAPRYQQPEGFNPRSPFGPGSVLPKSDGHAPAADFEVKATLSGRRYFRPGTTSFNDTRADVWFRTEADAQKAGFRPAQ